MAIESIKNTQGTAKINKTPDNANTKSENKQTKVDGSKLLLGSLAALAIGGGIYLLSRGKINKNIKEISEPEKLQEYTLETFKNAGNKFEKGIAKTASDKNFTGVIVKTGKDNTRYVIEYKDGILKKSTKYSDASQKDILWQKDYEYNDKNRLINIFDKDGKAILSRTYENNFEITNTSISKSKVDLDTKKLVYQRVKDKGEKYYYYTKNGDVPELAYVKYNHPAGKVTGGYTITKYENNKPAIEIMSDGEVSFLDESGNIKDKICFDRLCNLNDGWIYGDIRYRERSDIGKFIQTFNKTGVMPEFQIEKSIVSDTTTNILIFDSVACKETVKVEECGGNLSIITNSNAKLTEELEESVKSEYQKLKDEFLQAKEQASKRIEEVRNVMEIVH